MSGFTTPYERSLLNFVFAGASFAAPSSLTMGLFKSDPGDAGSTTGEVEGSSYSRQPITFSQIPVGEGGPLQSSSGVIFSGVDSGQTITHLAIFDQLNNMIGSGTLILPLVTDGSDLEFDAGEVLVDLD